MGRVLFTGRSVSIDGNWYAPQKYLESKNSIVDTYLYDRTSSAGDWTGYLVQKIGGCYYVIIFWQENNYPGKGFTLHTADYPCLKYAFEPSSETILKWIYKLEGGSI